MKKFLWLIVGVPAAVLLIVFSVANRQLIQFRLDPFNTDNPAIAVELPFFVFLFAALLAGMAIGGLAVWISQGQYRKTARAQKARADALTGQIASQSARLSAPGGQSRAA